MKPSAALSLIALGLLAGSVRADSDADPAGRKLRYVHGVVRGEGLMPWQENRIEVERFPLPDSKHFTLENVRYVEQ